MDIKVNKGSKEVHKMYEDLKDLDFIPRLKEEHDDYDILAINDGEKKKSMSKEMLISLSEALGRIRAKGFNYNHNNLTLDNLLFDGNSLSAIIGWDNLTIKEGIDDLLYLMDNYLDLRGEFTPEEYTLDLIITMVMHYDKYKDDLDLGYEMYWYFINKMNGLDKFSSLYEEYNKKLEFVIKYKPYLDELHEEEI